MAENLAGDQEIVQQGFLRVAGYYLPSSSVLAHTLAERELTVAVGFIPRANGRMAPRRGATLELVRGSASTVAPRRRSLWAVYRGLKATATITGSLRDLPRIEMRPGGGQIPSSHIDNPVVQ